MEAGDRILFGRCLPDPGYMETCPYPKRTQWRMRWRSSEGDRKEREVEGGRGSEGGVQTKEGARKRDGRRKGGRGRL